MSDGAGPIRSYRAFWPYYLREHSKPETRRIHIAGTLLSLALAATAILGGGAWFLAFALIAGYGLAWAAHFFVENNRPATFRYPLWSLVSDLRLTTLWLAGNLEHELEKAGIARSTSNSG